MPDWLTFFLQVALETMTLFALIVGLVGLIVPVFPGLTVMWLATLVYALVQGAADKMTGWDWFAFAIITLLMIVGNIVDNLIIAAKMRDQFIPWSSILLAFGISVGNGVESSDSIDRAMMMVAMPRVVALIRRVASRFPCRRHAYWYRRRNLRNSGSP